MMPVSRSTAQKNDIENDEGDNAPWGPNPKHVSFFSFPMALLLQQEVRLLDQIMVCLGLFSIEAFRIEGSGLRIWDRSLRV